MFLNLSPPQEVYCVIFDFCVALNGKQILISVETEKLYFCHSPFPYALRTSACLPRFPYFLAVARHSPVRIPGPEQSAQSPTQHPPTHGALLLQFTNVLRLPHLHRSALAIPHLSYFRSLLLSGLLVSFAINFPSLALVDRGSADVHGSLSKKNVNAYRKLFQIF
jgi:hypothetical protein